MNMSNRAPEGCQCKTCTTDSLVKTAIMAQFRQTGVARPGWMAEWEPTGVPGRGIVWIRAVGSPHWTDGFYHSSGIGDRS